MGFDLTHIHAFMAVAEELSFRRAAERLHLAQPALSRKIKWLEEDIGTQMFLRTTRNVELTDAGTIFKQECRYVLANIERAVEKTRNAAAGYVGYLTIAYMDFAINGRLPEILEDFRNSYPEIKVDLIYIPTQTQKKALIEEKIDIAFLIGPFIADNVSGVTLSLDRLVALLPYGHKLLKKENITIKDLVKEPLILGKEGAWNTFRTIVFNAYEKEGFYPNVVQDASTSDAIFGLVAAELGISIYSECARNIRRIGVEVRTISEELPTLPIMATWRSDNSSPSLKIFQQFISKYQVNTKIG